MLQKKVCMVGAFATGKTCLVSRFVKGFYSDKYQTTVGVKIDKKVVTVSNQIVNMVLWDIYGEDQFQKIRMSYLRGAAGYFLVIDGTRRETLETAQKLQQEVQSSIGNIPFIALVNKADIMPEWEIDDQDLADLEANQWTVVKTSAKTGLAVEQSFTQLALKMLEG